MRAVVDLADLAAGVHMVFRILGNEVGEALGQQIDMCDHQHEDGPPCEQLARLLVDGALT